MERLLRCCQCTFRPIAVTGTVHCHLSLLLILLHDMIQWVIHHSICYLIGIQCYHLGPSFLRPDPCLLHTPATSLFEHIQLNKSPTTDYHCPKHSKKIVTIVDIEASTSHQDLWYSFSHPAAKSAHPRSFSPITTAPTECTPLT